MKRSELRTIFEGVEGITDAHISKILNLSHAELDAVKDEKDDLQRQLDEAKKDGKAQEWEDKYNQEHQAFESYKADQKQKEARASKTAHLEELLTTAKFSDEGKKIIKAIYENKIDSLEADKDGKIKDAADLIAQLTKDWSNYVTTENKGGSGTDPGNPGGGNGGNKFEEMSLSEKMAFANDHPTDPQVTAWLNK
ncbi:MAG: hypothetical protein MJ097_00470 [Dorea sp.]|nr:hypothetical protein [Dorea sp.]